MENFSGDLFDVSEFQSIIIGGTLTGIAVTDNVFDEFLEKQSSNKYNIIYLRPIDNLLVMNFSKIPEGYADSNRSQHFVKYKPLEILKSYRAPWIQICVNKSEQTYLKPTEENSFMIQSNLIIDEFYDYTIGYLQGIIPKRKFKLNLPDKKLTFYFGEDPLNNRIPNDLAAQYIDKPENDTNTEGQDPMAALKQMSANNDKEHSNYVQFINNFHKGLINYYNSLDDIEKNKLKETIGFYLELKSNPSHTNLKLLLLFSCIETLNVFCNSSTNEKINSILNAMENEINVTTCDETNNMLRRLRNGLAHYQDHLKKLNETDKTKFSEKFNNSLDQIYYHLITIIDRFFMNKANVLNS